MIKRVDTIAFHTKRGRGFFQHGTDDALMYMRLEQLEELKKHVADVIRFKKSVAKLKHCRNCFAVANHWRKTCPNCKSDNLKS